MEHMGVTILNAHRTMAISTTRPDGWSQTTIVGYANVDFDVYFLIFRSSQKFQNIGRDNRVSIAVGQEPADLHELKAVYAAARASEITEPQQRKSAWNLLLQRHPNLSDFELPDASETAMMCASCKHISILDYSQGLGHTEVLTLSDSQSPVHETSRKDSWGAAAARATG